jgi:superfamily II DNA or RNA helicase
MPELRQWQEDAILRYMEHRPSKFLLEACPAAGKTRFAAEVARRLMAAGIVDRVLVVVPLRTLREQVAETFSSVGIELILDWNGDGVMPAGGVAVTYAWVASASLNVRRELSLRRTLVILDEVHHVGDDRSWGTHLEEALSPATRILMLSGTPFRSDQAAIAFVAYDDDGEAIVDYRYTYRNALDDPDSPVRFVYFPRKGGEFRWMDGDGEQSATFDDDVGPQAESRRLRTALMAGGGHIGELLREGVSQLELFQADDPVAAGLIIAMDQAHAKDLWRRMRKDFGIRAVLAISEDADAGTAIGHFRESHDSWLIAVDMVSEGVDIPRLRVLVYATNVLTPMYFRQAVGRIIRRTVAEDDPSAAMVIPDDARLRAHAESIERQVQAALAERERRSRTPDGGEDVPSSFIPLSSTGEARGVTVGDTTIGEGELRAVERIKLLSPITAAMNTVQLAIVLRNANKLNEPVITDSVSAGSPGDPPLFRRLVRLRQENNIYARRIAARLGGDDAYMTVNRLLNAHVGISSVKTCHDPEILGRRLNAAQRWFTGEELTEASDA